jgi:dTDP-4-dehydrorhamnose 3,5-epimerase
MQVIQTAIPEVQIIEPKVFGDSRGFFFESFNGRDFAQATGLQVDFVQDNHSKSSRGVLRGLHYQIQQSSTSPWTCVRVRQPSASGWACI